MRKYRRRDAKNKSVTLSLSERVIIWNHIRPGDSLDAGRRSGDPPLGEVDYAQSRQEGPYSDSGLPVRLSKALSSLAETSAVSLLDIQVTSTADKTGLRVTL